MGLDVGLGKCSDCMATLNEKHYEEQDSKLSSNVDFEKARQGDVKAMADVKEYEKKIEEIAKSKGLDKFGTSLSRTKIEQDSKKHPKHMFKIGYFRSSYNGSGYNHFIDNNIGLNGLYYIFDKQLDDYYFTPNWKDSLDRAKEVLSKLKKLKKEGKDVMMDCFRLPMVVSSEFIKKMPKTEFEAKEQLNEEQSKGKNNSFSSYSNYKGEFHLGKDPLKIVSLQHGVVKNILTDKWEPCVYLGYKGDFAFYLQATEIVVEAVKYVLAQPDVSDYYLTWSA
jgi:hypothetical protein